MLKASARPDHLGRLHLIRRCGRANSFFNCRLADWARYQIEAVGCKKPFPPKNPRFQWHGGQVSNVRRIDTPRQRREASARKPHTKRRPLTRTPKPQLCPAPAKKRESAYLLFPQQGADSALRGSACPSALPGFGALGRAASGFDAG